MAAALSQAWEEGYLGWKLKKYQLPAYDAVKAAEASVDLQKHRRFVINCSRRFGKTTLLCVLALEECIKRADIHVRYVAPTAKMVRKAIHPIIRSLCEDAPESVRPVFRLLDGSYLFPNGSELHIAGADAGGADGLRGQTAHLAIIDEAAFVAELEYLVKSILSPQLLSTKGRLVMASTPAISTDSDFYQLAMQAKTDGIYLHRTIYDTSYDKEDVEQFCKDAGGPQSSTWRREYLAEFVIDESRAVVPEFNETIHIAEIGRPEYFDHLFRYVSMDIGTRDLTAILFGYYDFPKARLIIEAEKVIQGPEMTTQILADQVKEIEGRIWPNLKVQKRVADSITDLLVNDLSQLHNLPASRPDKDQLHAMVNEIRLWMNTGRIKIDPKCEHLIACLKEGVWDLQRKEFQRSKHLGHLDGLAALTYLVRTVDTYTNSIPNWWGKSPKQIWWDERLKRVPQQRENKVLQRMLNIRPRARRHG